MSLGKKVIFLFAIFIALNVYTLTTFDYKSILGEETKVETSLFDTKVIIEYINEVRNKAYLMKDELLIKMGVEERKEIEIEKTIVLEQPKQNEENVVLKLTVDKPEMIDNEENTNNNDNITKDITSITQNNVKNTENIDNKLDKNQEIVKKDENLEKNKEKVTKNEVDEDISNTSQTPKQIQSIINEILAENKIVFKRRSVKITKESNSTVEKIAEILKENNTLIVEVAGHTDSRGKASLNKRISQDRANSVRKILISLGVEKDRLKAVGYGEKFPVAKDDKDGLSAINRRVEINILGDKK